jgi:tetratricopeptide (TPR) repeat protein
MALRLGLPELASAALDGIGTSYYGRGRYGEMSDVTERRLKLLPDLRDPREIEDVYAMAAWSAFHVGDYREALRYAHDGFERSLPIMPAIALHCLEWRALAKYRLGDWPGFFEDVAVAEALMGDRTESPPAFISRPFAIGALLYEVQGRPADARRVLARWPWREETEELDLCAPWLALLAARRGRFDEARDILERARGQGRVNRGLVLEAACDVLLAEQSWDRAAETVAAARAHAKEGGLLALPCHADRLDGVAHLARGDKETGLRLVAGAREGFASLGAQWEAARTTLLLANGGVEYGPGTGARSGLEGAVSVFRELGSTKELEEATRLLDEFARS